MDAEPQNLLVLDIDGVGNSQEYWLRRSLAQRQKDEASGIYGGFDPLVMARLNWITALTPTTVVVSSVERRRARMSEPGALEATLRRYGYVGAYAGALPFEHDVPVRLLQRWRAEAPEQRRYRHVVVLDDMDPARFFEGAALTNLTYVRTSFADAGLTTEGMKTALIACGVYPPWEWLRSVVVALADGSEWTIPFEWVADACALHGSHGPDGVPVLAQYRAALRAVLYTPDLALRHLRTLPWSDLAPVVTQTRDASQPVTQALLWQAPTRVYLL